MTQNAIHVRATRHAIRCAVARLPAAMVAGGPDADAVLLRAGLAILGRIRTAFIVKARGGTDEAGESWRPLSPRTIAYSKTRQRGKGGRTRAEKGRATRPSQALSQKQQDRWWEVYRKYLAVYKGDKRHAAAVAWTILKREGARTLVDKYGHRQVEILRDTGMLLNSLSPGTGGADQVFRVSPGAVVVGTNRKGAAVHHRGVPGRLPQRRLWPHPSKWPASWWMDITDQIKQGLLDMITNTVQSGV